MLAHFANRSIDLEEIPPGRRLLDESTDAADDFPRPIYIFHDVGEDLPYFVQITVSAARKRNAAADGNGGACRGADVRSGSS